MNVRWLLVLLLIAACKSPVERATELVEKGEVERAEALLRRDLSDPEARLFLGSLALKRNDVQEAEALFALVPPAEEWRGRIAAAYRTAMREARKQDDEKAIAAYAYRAYQWSRKDPGQVCRDLTGIIGQRLREKKQYGELLELADSFDGACGTALAEALPRWIRTASAEEAASLVGRITTLTPEQAREVALALRREAAEAAEQKDERASLLLDLVARVSPAVGGELETVVLRSRLTADQPVAEVPRPVAATTWLMAMYRDGSPLEVTLRVLRNLGGVLDAYATDANRYPRAASVSDLRRWLVPQYMPDLPATDGWGQPLVYVVAPDGRSMRLISGGIDHQVSPRSTDFRVSAGDSGQDVIWENGRIVQQPAMY